MAQHHNRATEVLIHKTGSLASVRRHDYLPFGEEIGGPQVALLGGRTPLQGYAGDSVRQKFTQYEGDGETGLAYANHRYYASQMGRFTSPDPYGGSGISSVPQSWNKYSYCINRPLLFTDPSGLTWLTMDDRNFIWIPDDEYNKNRSKYKNYSVGNGAITNYQSSTNCPACANVSQGQWVQLNADGSVTPVSNPTAFIYVEYSDDEISNPVPVVNYAGTVGKATFKQLEGGPPNSYWTFPNKGGGYTNRWFDNNGRAWVDVDHGHDHGAGDPHVHWWDWKGHWPERSEGEPVPEGMDIFMDDGGSLVVDPNHPRRPNSVYAPMGPLGMPGRIPFRVGLPQVVPWGNPILVP